MTYEEGLVVTARQLIEDYPDETDEGIAEKLVDILQADTSDFEDPDLLGFVVLQARAEGGTS